MTTFRTIIDTSTLELTATGSLTGQIWLEFAGQAYPEVGWNDFVTVIVGWWCDEVADLVGHDNGEGRLRFMDGPFSVTVSLEDKGVAVLSAQAGRGSSVGIVYRCKLEEVRRQILAAADVALEHCERHGIDNHDVRVLKLAARRLKDA